MQDKNRVVLTMEDLSLALAEHGVNVKKPDYCESPLHDDQRSFPPTSLLRKRRVRSVRSCVHYSHSAVR